MSNPLLAGLNREKEIRPKPKIRTQKPRTKPVTNELRDKIKELESKIETINEIVIDLKLHSIKPEPIKDDTNEFINWILGLDETKYPVQGQLIKQMKKYGKKAIIKNIMDLYREFKGE